MKHFKDDDKNLIKRSAFTCWKNIPSRFDPGKEKYMHGETFTYKELEDVKTMFRLLLLMFSLFGFHLSGDGYSLTTYIVKTVGCPNSINWNDFESTTCYHTHCNCCYSILPVYEKNICHDALLAMVYLHSYG